LFRSDFYVQINYASVNNLYRKMSKKVRGRGRPRTNPTSIHLTLVPDLLGRLDAFIADQDEELSRADGVRRVLDEALPPAKATPKRGQGGAAK
jgi:hypothetical protein